MANLKGIPTPVRARVLETAALNGMNQDDLLLGLISEGLDRLAAEGLDVAPLRSVEQADRLVQIPPTALRKWIRTGNRVIDLL